MSPGPAARFNSLNEAAREIAKEFLQSVVVVDDRAAMGPEPVDAKPVLLSDLTEPPNTDNATGRSRPGGKRLALATPQLAKSQDVPDQALDAKALIDGFADAGLVCAVIRPTERDDSIERTLLAAARADIVVLDWEINADDGATTLNIISELVARDAARTGSTRLRLIAIYSGEILLREIASQIRDAIRRAGIKDLRKTGAFTVRVGHARIVVYSKPTSRFKQGGPGMRGLQRRVVTPSELPQKLIEEFAMLTTGLVPNVALASLAAVRRNTHRILANMGRNLDPAYLWHRAMQTRPADAQDHLVSLIADEMSAVIEDERVGEWADMDAIRHWINDNHTDDIISQRFGETSPRSREDLYALLETGTAGKEDACQQVKKKFGQMGDKAHKKQIAAFAKTPQELASSNRQLAALLSLRTRYVNPPPRLELGSILRRGRGSATRYWLCVQPRCDSVRLSGEVSFPLMPLRLAGDREWEVLLPGQNDTYQQFAVAKRPSDLENVVFSVYPETADSVNARKDKRGYYFRAKGNHRYDWVADLKKDHAQKIAQDVGNMFTRVGLTESEWARRWAPK